MIWISDDPNNPSSWIEYNDETWYIQPQYEYDRRLDEPDKGGWD